MNASIELPKYRCHKQVWALLIAAIQPKASPDPTGQSMAASYGAVIVPANDRYAPLEVSAEYVMKHNPEPGGYYVLYEDGYASYSPAAPFESGYSLIQPSTATPSRGSQDVGLTIVNEGQDSQRVVFARIEDAEAGPQIVDQEVLAPGQELRTTLRPGLVVQLAPWDESLAAANDDQVQQPQGESEG